MISLLRVNGKPGQDVGRGEPCSVGGEVAVGGILLKEITTRQSVLVVEDVIPVAHSLMIVECRGICEAGERVLRGVACARRRTAARSCIGAWHHILPVGQL